MRCCARSKACDEGLVEVFVVIELRVVRIATAFSPSQDAEPRHTLHEAGLVIF
jgi:hypothetical protein